MVREVRVNIRLRRAIIKKFGSTANLCRTWPGLIEKKCSQSRVSALIHLRESPFTRYGALSSVCQTISEALGILSEKLFPAELYRDVIPFNVEITAFHPQNGMPIRELCQLAKIDGESFDETVQKSLQSRIAKVFRTISYREREILKLRYGLADGFTYTLDEVAHIFKLHRERIRQIEAKAVRKLQQPERSQELAGFLD